MVGSGYYTSIYPGIFQPWTTLRGCDTIKKMTNDTSIYLHIPFCLHRCAYCDFNTYAGQDRFREAYVEALCEEIRLVAQASPEPIQAHTIFFGGGTPSLLDAGQMEKILQAIHQNFSLTIKAEISLEANPGTVSLDYLRDLHALGFNRISLGMQSAHPDDLRLLERQHTYLDVIHAVAWARQAGFDNLNLDLMFGLPHQTFERWEQTLNLALGLNPEHLSLYALTLEHGTPFQRWTDRGLIPTADDDLAADMYEAARDRLGQAGYEHYEISNWARKSDRRGSWKCLHNLQYWRDLPYLGFGAGAHGYAGGIRTANIPGIQAYIKRLQGSNPNHFPASPAAITATPIDLFTEAQEMMMVGLRLVDEGVSSRVFEKRIGQSLGSLFGKEIGRLVESGLLEWVGLDDRRLRLTRRGQLLGNQVFMQFVGEER